MIRIVEMTVMAEGFFTSGQFAVLRRRAEAPGVAGMQGALARWQTPIAGARQAMSAGHDPRSGPVARFALRWRELADLLVGGDQEITAAAELYWRAQPAKALAMGFDRALCHTRGATRPRLSCLDKNT